jgi:hypothetical protein
LTPIPNIGARGRRRRFVGGLAALLLAVLLGVALAGQPLPVRALLFLPLLAAAHGILQAREKT